MKVSVVGESALRRGRWRRKKGSVVQPEEQHGLRPERRLGKHLLTAKVFLDKATAANAPSWIVNLDPSNACDRVNWSAAWSALAAHGDSKSYVDLAVLALMPHSVNCRGNLSSGGVLRVESKPLVHRFGVGHELLATLRGHSGF